MPRSAWRISFCVLPGKRLHVKPTNSTVGDTNVKDDLSAYLRFPGVEIIVMTFTDLVPGRPFPFNFSSLKE